MTGSLYESVEIRILLYPVVLSGAPRLHHWVRDVSEHNSTWTAAGAAKKVFMNAENNREISAQKIAKKAWKVT